MKRLLLFAALTLTLAAQAQTITIGEESNLSSQVPIYTMYTYSFTEQLFRADEIEYAGNIKAVRFRIAYTYNSEHTSDIVVYMKHVSKDTFSAPSDYEPVTAADQVYAGPWTIPADTDDWIPIEFDTPFAYNGTDNLLVAIAARSNDFAIRYFKYSDAPSTVLSCFSDDQQPDPEHLEGFSGIKEVIEKRSNIKLVFGGSVGVEEHSANALSAYPNPAKDLLYLGGIDQENVKVYDISGRLVMQENYTGPLHIEGLESGLYMVATSKGIVRFMK